MCRNTIKMMFAGMNLSPAVLFMNSNKSECNLRRIIKGTRQECRSHGIELQHEFIVNKGPNRDIDRDAINMLISLLITGKYEIVVVNKMTDLTDDLSDLDEFMKDTFAIGVHFFELSTMQFHFRAYSDKGCGKERPIWDGGSGC